MCPADAKGFHHRYACGRRRPLQLEAGLQVSLSQRRPNLLTRQQRSTWQCEANCWTGHDRPASGKPDVQTDQRLAPELWQHPAQPPAHTTATQTKQLSLQYPVVHTRNCTHAVSCSQSAACSRLQLLDQSNTCQAPYWHRARLPDTCPAVCSTK